MLVNDFKAKMNAKIEEQLVFDTTYYPTQEKQRDEIIRIAAEVYSESLDNVKELAKTTDEIFTERFQIFLPPSNIAVLIIERFLRDNKDKV
jgi:hypothetical protein